MSRSQGCTTCLTILFWLNNLTNFMVTYDLKGKNTFWLFWGAISIYFYVQWFWDHFQNILIYPPNSDNYLHLKCWSNIKNLDNFILIETVLGSLNVIPFPFFHNFQQNKTRDITICSLIKEINLEYNKETLMQDNQFSLIRWKKNKYIEKHWQKLAIKKSRLS